MSSTFKTALVSAIAVTAAARAATASESQNTAPQPSNNNISLVDELLDLPTADKALLGGLTTASVVAFSMLLWGLKRIYYQQNAAIDEKAAAASFSSLQSRVASFRGKFVQIESRDQPRPCEMVREAQLDRDTLTIKTETLDERRISSTFVYEVDQIRLTKTTIGIIVEAKNESELKLILTEHDPIAP